MSSVKKYKYKFSFVMPVYNVEKYLEEAIESIFAQDIGFSRVQIVLINDGSTDGSGDICIKYKNLYPDNIIYIEQSNKGVSSARNIGIRASEGEYIGFLDSDDIISKDTCRKVYSFFAKNKKKIDIVAIKIKLFGAKQGDHYLNYKFQDGDRVIDIEDEYSALLNHGAPVFIKSEAIGKRKFDTNLKVGEDTVFIHGILLDKMKYGVVSDPTYYYRQRIEGGSAVDTRHTLGWYDDVPDRFFGAMARASKKKHKHITKYTQYCTINHLGHRLKEPHLDDLSEEQRVKYQQEIDKAIKYLDDGMILGYRNKLASEYRLYMLSRKYGRDISGDLAYRSNGKLYFKDFVVSRIDKMRFNVEFIDVQDDKLVIEGWCSGFCHDQLDMYIKVGKDRYPVEKVERPFWETYSMGEKIYDRYKFKVSIPVEGSNSKRIQPVVMVAGRKYVLTMLFRKFSGISRSISWSYKLSSRYFIVLNDNILYLQRYSKTRHIKREIKYSLNILKQKDNYKYKAIGYRLAKYLVGFLYQKSEVWLVSDRSYTTGDNGYYLFKYLASQEAGEIKAYFTLSKECDRYREVKEYGKVLPYTGFRHKVLFLVSSKVISAYTDPYIVNIFGDKMKFFCDLYTFDYVYIQHGVMAANLAGILNRYNKNMKLITTSSTMERDAIVSDSGYGYSPAMIRMAGQPRFDGLVGKAEKKVVVMPTWRKYLMGTRSDVNGVQMSSFNYTSTLKRSEYFQYYNTLINDRRVIDVLRKYGYRMEFFIHPVLTSNHRDFHTVYDDVVDIMSPPNDYEHALVSGKIMVTDYSGVAFDFAYQKKPVLYAQFDADKFHSGHYGRGYYSFEKNGFGPVLKDYESLVKALISSIKSDGKIQPKYKQRVESFFDTIDTNNSKRVYETILDMDR